MMPRKFENPQYPSPIRSLPSDPRRKLTKSGSFDYTGMNTKSYPASL